MDDYCKRSGQIPAFGDWDYANQLPITQYFECARQAGLLRYSSSSGDSDPYVRPDDLYAVDIKKHSRTPAPPPRKTSSRAREKRGPHIKEQKRQGKVCDVTDLPRKQQHLQNPSHVPLPCSNNNNIRNNTSKGSGKLLQPQRRPPKAVDEDLYKIPPELLRSSKRKKMPGFFSCLVPACAS